MALDARDTGWDAGADVDTPILPRLAALETPGAGGRPRHFCGDLDLFIDREGVWHYQGSPIGRKEMVCLFASVLHRAEDGTYWMVTPAEVGRVEVEDVPFVAVEMFAQPCGCGPSQCVSFRTNCDDVVTVDDEHPLRIEHDPETGEPIPYVTVRDGLDARLTRSVYYDLVARGVEDTSTGERRFGVWSRERFFSLGTLDED
ncbi:DUF1285 domain-containing protein [Roseospira marina]|uniref:DUF1285 domain-containing protein n=1 Tax=Roseospira marina TaxID=140057 RepID=A0A5M6I913_9PROT|nr:DUF1285 domain-containing protein [Roseospira marina]KAA5604642.1 DUF1285 domain-containing protein [Roseospira marina]MBB4315084.1 hypothetical protein [Roseospira marina]MBB5088146.1 hypothetical protein [Roseospira marina]